MQLKKEYQKTPRDVDLPPLIDFTTRLSKSSVVSIVEIRGRIGGVGSEFALACDMRFASLEKAVFGQPELAVGIVPATGAIERLSRLSGRDLINRIRLPESPELQESRFAFISGAMSPGTLEKVSKSMTLGFGSHGDFEFNLGQRLMDVN
ncbi:enoyl-CoA hydratase/isomerase family protein [Paenibacillus sp. NPDC058177]|uniref:enoyl-CoA hydratase/isomerase family protein n=1 Tax=Paenibacillus sp. NPDC058177 TaxID=3346369 RepID=UPI0036D8C652